MDEKLSWKLEKLFNLENKFLLFLGRNFMSEFCGYSLLKKLEEEKF